MKNLQDKIVRETKCSIRADDTPGTGWYMEEPLYTILDCENLGLMYNRKSRCIPFESPQYEILLDCVWDDIRVVDAEEGAYVIVRANGKCELFNLIGHIETIREDEQYHQNIFHISANPIKNHIHHRRDQMKIVEIPEYLCGTQHVNLPHKLDAAYKELFIVTREKFPGMKLSKFFPMCGKYYGEKLQWSRTTPFDSFDPASEEEQKKYLEPAVNLMVVGRSTNGWAELDECDAREFAASAAYEMTAYQGFSWLRNDGQVKETYIREHDGVECRYNINKSAFFRTTKHIMEQLKPVTKFEPRWFEYITWNNLYPISPYEGGNAEGELQDAQLEICKKLMLQQIEFYQPTHILFITDWDYWFDRFADVFPEVQKNGDRTKDNVVGFGVYNSIKVVVTIRPDRTRPNKPNEDAFARDVVKCFDDIQLVD